VDPEGKIKPTGRSFLTSRLLLVILGFGMAAITVFLWKAQESRNLAQMEQGVAAKARLYASETEIRYNRIYAALERLAKKSAQNGYLSQVDWRNDARFYIQFFQGMERIALVDKSFRIQMIEPYDEHSSMVGQLANEVEWETPGFNLWLPIYDRQEFKGYLLGMIHLPDLMAPVIGDVKEAYMFQLLQEGTPIFSSENWHDAKAGYLVERMITLQNTAVLDLALAPTNTTIEREKTNARSTLAFGLLFAFIALIAVYFAQKFRLLSELNQLRYRNTLESMVEGCQIIGPDWRFLFVNDTAAAQKLCKQEDMVGRTIFECDPEMEQSELYALLQRCMQARLPQKTIHLIRNGDGSESWYELSIQPAPDGILILSNDISERKRAEQALQNLNVELERRVEERTAQLVAANQELEAFSYSVSHDLRAPLRAIDGFSTVLLSDYVDQFDPQGRHLLTRIQEGSKRMGELISDLLALSHIGRSELVRREVDLSQIAVEISMEIRERDPQRTVEFQIESPLLAQADARLLRIALQNLMENAWKFSRANPQTRIELGLFHPAPEAAYGSGGNEKTYFIRDNGVGFDMNYAGKLFAPFQRLHTQEQFPGSGIGLAIVKRIINRHGGRIWVESHRDEGATFFFTLGAAAQPAL